MSFLPEKAPRRILFDLDGTLLPMDLDVYVKHYFKGLSRDLKDIPDDVVVQTLWEGIDAMMRNESGLTNREVFAQIFTARTGVDYFANEEAFMAFYRTGYNDCIAACQPTPLANKIVKTLRGKGYDLTLATSPLYPAVATHSRMRWAGLDEKDFSLVTTFDDFHAAKPHLLYYKELCARLDAAPGECLMVGNDVIEDGAAREIGMPVLLVTDCLINKKNLPLEGFYTATLREVLAWAEALG